MEKGKMEEIHTFKTQYNKEEVEEVINWFEEQMEQLPRELQISNSMRTSNLPDTVKKLIKFVESNEQTATFSGYASHLFLIRERLKTMQKRE